MVQHYKQPLHLIIAIAKTIVTISKHRIALAKAGRKLGVSWKRILKHDNSKFHPIEFMQYVGRFELGTNEPQKWAKAWRHHWKNNDHHIEYWEDKDLTFTLSPNTKNGDIVNEVRLGGGTKKSWKGPVWMSDGAVREMIADWIAGSFAYSGRYPKAGDWKWGNKNLVDRLMRLETQPRPETCTRSFAISLLRRNELITDEQIKSISQIDTS